MSFLSTKPLILAAAVVSISVPAFAVNFTEVEPNDSKLLATPVVLTGVGDTITGLSTGSSTTVPGTGSADYYRVTTAPAALGIYKHTLAISTAGTAGHTGTIRGLLQSAGVINPVSDSAFQSSSTSTTAGIPARSNVWYGFGKAESIYYRVSGGTATTVDYVSTFSSTPVVATNVGSFTTGPITISTVGQTTVDTDLWVYDSAFNAIPTYGNDDESVAGGGTGTTLQSLLTRTYAPGTYYLALSNFGVANDQAAALDDDFRSGTVLDFPNAIANSSTTINLDLDFLIGPAGGALTPVSALKVSGFDVNFYQFTVTAIPEPTTLGLLAAAPLVLVRRRK